MVAELGGGGYGELLCGVRGWGSLERGVEGHQFIEEAADSPHVGLAVVGFVLPHLGGDVVGRADLGLGKHLRRLQQLRGATVRRHNRWWWAAD